MNTEIKNLISLLQTTYYNGAWHGPSVKEVLDQVTEEKCKQKFSNSHSIIELVEHMSTWKNLVARRLLGDLAFKVSEEENFPKPTSWSNALRNLEHSQKNLILALENFPPEKLNEEVISTTTKHSYYKLIHGVIHHDLYHTGQIILILKNSS